MSEAGKHESGRRRGLTRPTGDQLRESADAVIRLLLAAGFLEVFGVSYLVANGAAGLLVGLAACFGGVLVAGAILLVI